MLDESGNFAGVAARELEEELGFIIDPKELVDLGAVFDRPWPGMFPSPGACEEFIRLFFFERDITRAELEKFRGRQTGLREEGEFIMLSVIRLEDLPRTTPDGKSLASFGLYLARYLKSKGRPLFGSD
jgi:ADP-sugar diphosphatase